MTEEDEQQEHMRQEEEDDHHDDDNSEEAAANAQSPAAAATLSKSWTVSTAHVPTFTGGKVTHCHTKGIRNLTTDEDDTSETPFLLLPVNGDLALVDARRGHKARTIRGVVENEFDDDNDEGVDADAISSYCLSHNDETLITCSLNHLIRQYSLQQPHKWKEGQPLAIEKTWGRSGHTLPVTHMEFHLSDVFVATGSVDGVVRIWDVRGGYVTHVLRPLEIQESGGMHGVTSLSWRSSTKILQIAIGRANGSVAIHDLRKPDETVLLKDHVSAVTCMQWGDVFNRNNDNTEAAASMLQNIFVTAGRDAVIHTYRIGKEHAKKMKKKRSSDTTADSKTVYQRIHTLPIYEQVEGMVVVPSTHSSDDEEGLVIATAGSKGSIRLFKAIITENEHGGDNSMTISGFTCRAEQPAYQAFGQDRGGYLQLEYLAAAAANEQDGDDDSKQHQLIVADAEHNLSFLSLNENDEKSDFLLSVERTIVGHNDEVLDLKLVSNSGKIAVATNSAQVRLFDLKTFSCSVLDGHSATVLCVDVSPCGRYLATCGKDKTMRLWQDQKCVAVATGHTEAVGATALSKKVGRYQVGGKAAKNGGGAFCVTASKDRTLKRWNLPGPDGFSSQIIELDAFASVRAHEKDINIVSVAPNDSLIATGSQDKTVKLWRATDLSLQGTLKGHRRGVWDCQFSPHDRVVATCSGDKTVKLWSLNDYSCVRTFQGHVASALRVRFLSGGLQLMSSGADGLVKLWTIRTNECEATLDNHHDKVWAMDLSMDGATLVTGGADSQIVIWKDTTVQEESAKREKEEQTILMEQRLSNHLRHKEFEQALEIALELEKPRQALKVLTMIVENDVQKGRQDGGLATLSRHVKSWPAERTTQVLGYCREWNTRARNCHIAMLIVKAIVTTIPANVLASMDGVPEILAGITPYAERHFDRLDRMYTSSYLLDFCLYSMDGGLDDEELEKDFAAWETRSKLVLPPKQVDGRIQIGGAPLVGAREGDKDESGSESDEVLTIGDSSDDDSSSSSEDDSDDDRVAIAKGKHAENDDDSSSSSSSGESSSHSSSSS